MPDDASRCHLKQDFFSSTSLALILLLYYLLYITNILIIRATYINITTASITFLSY